MNAAPPYVIIQTTEKCSAALCILGGKQQGWAKLLKKTESYKEIFNLFDKVRDIPI